MRRIATILVIAATLGTSSPVRSEKPRGQLTGSKDVPVDQLHASQFMDDPFPSAAKCASCHEDHYREWSASPHAYSQMSPLFNALANKQIRDTSGTLGDFCIRCHAPVRAALAEPAGLSNLDRHPTSREGVTCVVCHRINQAWGKVSGRQALLPGNIYSPVFGPRGNEILADAFARQEFYGPWKTEPDPGLRGRDVHAAAIGFFEQTIPGFCGSCHDVSVPNGFHLTDTFSEFKHSAAARANHSCQDCHMGVVPGAPAGYATAPAAKIGNVFTPARKRTNHLMAGPSPSVLHPGIFPHNPAAVRDEGGPNHQLGLATMREWLLFDHRAGWGSPEFEQSVSRDYPFPQAWRDSVRRYRARSILTEQFSLLAEARRQRMELLRRGYWLGEIVVDRAAAGGIRFRIPVGNQTVGHGAPAGAGKPATLVFLRVAVLDAAGKLVFSSGDLDPNGDVRDDHSLYVRRGVLARDPFLFSLQTRYLTRNLRGGEREQVLSINYSRDPLPFVRPATRPTTVQGRPQSVRRHKLNIEPGGLRWADYHVGARQLTGVEPYSIFAQLVSGALPVNLIHEMSAAGFDYGLSARDVARRVVEEHHVVHERSTVVGPCAK